MTKEEQIKSVIQLMQQREKEYAADPEKARQWLIALGILDKSGKRLSPRYRR